MTTNGDLLQIARDAVALGADMVKNTRPRQIREKSDRDIVTDVDIEVERAVKDHLKKETPDIGFLGEEEGTTDPDAEYLWTLDPIDGTSNYAHGIPLCATQLALLHNKRSIVAAITAPFLDLRYYATEGTGAYCNDHQIRASQADTPSKAIVSIGDYATGQQAPEKNSHRLRLTALLSEKVERVRMFGSAALDLAWVAESRTDATVILANKPWDTAAGVLLAREAGALALNGNGDPHDFQSSDTVVTSPHLANTMVSLVQTVYR